jgi:hypothetical protein
VLDDLTLFLELLLDVLPLVLELLLDVLRDYNLQGKARPRDSSKDNCSRVVEVSLPRRNLEFSSLLELLSTLVIETIIKLLRFT